MGMKYLLPVLLASIAAAQTFSAEKEAALGAGLAQDVRKQTTPLESATAQAYVEKIAAALSPGSKYHFELMSSPRQGWTNESVTLPGGYIFVPTGLLLSARNESEFAGMLAHAIAHIDHRDGARLASPTGALGSIPLIFIGGLSQNALLPRGMMKLQHQFELEADQSAVATMSGAGYDPRALAAYIGRTQPDAPASPKVFVGMPSRDERLAAIEQAAKVLPTPEPRSDEEFQKVQSEVRTLVPAKPEVRPTLRRN
jgi:beta-barrel assembly-enhancing protease